MAMLGRRAALLLALIISACGGPVVEPQPPSGQLIAFGGGPGGPRDACFTCHGLRGEGDGAAPALAGLEAGYIMKQLVDYAHQMRPDDVMTPIARRMRDGDRLAVAAYYAQLASAPRRGAEARLALYHSGDRARALRACAACHGESGLGKGANPAIAGQPALYTGEQLRRWKRSVRRNDAGDVMGAAARALSEEEIDALAHYIERMR